MKRLLQRYSISMRIGFVWLRIRIIGLVIGFIELLHNVTTNNYSANDNSRSLQLIDGSEIVSLMRRPPFTPPGRFLVLIFVRG
jgi:hypothetical protein